MGEEKGQNSGGRGNTIGQVPGTAFVRWPWALHTTCAVWPQCLPGAHVLSAESRVDLRVLGQKPQGCRSVADGLPARPSQCIQQAQGGQWRPSWDVEASVPELCAEPISASQTSSSI